MAEARRTVEDVLDYSYAQELLDEGLTIRDIANDFDFEYSAVQRFIKRHTLTVRNIRKSPVKVLDHIDLEMLIDLIQDGQSSASIGREIDNFTPDTVDSFVRNNGATMRGIREDSRPFRKAVLEREKKRKQKLERKQAKKNDN